MIGTVLAGGLARRMGGGDKPLLALAGRPILAHVLDALDAQCGSVVIAANGDPARFATYARLVLPDEAPDRPGPLAGILAGLDHAAASGAEFVLSVPGDAPFLPIDLVARLEDRRVADRALVVRAATRGGRVHHTVALWATSLRDDLRRSLRAGDRKVSAFAERHPIATVEWPGEPLDPFFNVNTPEDLAEAERLSGLSASMDRPGSLC